jgi:hypothetical protein
VDVLHRRDQARPCGVGDGVVREDLVPHDEGRGRGRRRPRWR